MRAVGARKPELRMKLVSWSLVSPYTDLYVNKYTYEYVHIRTYTKRPGKEKKGGCLAAFL